MGVAHDMGMIMNRPQLYRIVDHNHKHPLFLTSTFQASTAVHEAELFRQKCDAEQRAERENRLLVLRCSANHVSTSRIWRGYDWEVETIQ